MTQQAVVLVFLWWSASRAVAQNSPQQLLDQLKDSEDRLENLDAQLGQLKRNLGSSEVTFSNVTQEVTGHQEDLWNLSKASLYNRGVLHEITKGGATMQAEVQNMKSAAQLLESQANDNANKSAAVAQAAEELSSMGSVKIKTGVCLAAKDKDKEGSDLQMWTCTKGQKTQQWALNPATGLFKNMHGICIAAPDPGTAGSKVMMWGCDASSAAQKWSYAQPAGQLKTSGGLCLNAATPSEKGSAPTLAACDLAAPGQAWDMTVGNVGARERMDGLTSEMWALQDPSSPKSIAEQEKTVGTLETDLSTFSDLLATKSRTVLASRLRHRANNLRKAIQTLGDATGGLADPGSVPGVYAQEPPPCDYDNEPLGADLGLAS